MKVLIADDDRIVRSLIKTYLQKDGHTVDEAENGQIAINKMHQDKFDFILLDIIMPIKDGYQTLIEIRQRSVVPVIVLSSRTDQFDDAFLRSYGADEFVLKPFSPTELATKMQNVVRKRRESNKEDRIINPGHFIINIDLKTVFIDGIQLPLTETEFDILLYLARADSKPVPFHELYNQVYDVYSPMALEIIEEHIRMIRIKSGKYKTALMRVGKFDFMFDGTRGKVL